MKTDKGNFLIQSNLASIQMVDVYARVDAVRTKLVALGCTFDMSSHDAVHVTVPKGKEFEAEAICAELFPGVRAEDLVAIAGQLEPVRCSNTIQKAPCPGDAAWIGTARYPREGSPSERAFCAACADALKRCMPGGFSAWRPIPGASFEVKLGPDATRKIAAAADHAKSVWVVSWKITQDGGESDGLVGVFSTETEAQICALRSINDNWVDDAWDEYDPDRVDELRRLIAARRYADALAVWAGMPTSYEVSVEEVEVERGAAVLTLDEMGLSPEQDPAR